MRPTPLAAALAAVLTMAHAPAFGRDLLQALRDAQEYDPVLAAARAELLATRERIPQARAGLLPSANAFAAVSRQGVDSTLRSDRYYVTPENYSIQLSVPVYRMQNKEAFEQSKLVVSNGEVRFSQVQQDLILRVAAAYFDVLSAQDNLATIRAQKRAIAEQLASAKRNFEVGTATVTDQQEAQARYDLTVAQELFAENDLAVKRSRLTQLTGKPVGSLKVLRQGINVEEPQPSREAAWTESARENSFAVQQASLGAEIAKREIDRQRYAHYPTIDVVSSVNRLASALPTGTSYTQNAATIGLQLNLPIYQGGAIDSRVREAAALYDKSRSDLENARRLSELVAREAYLSLFSGLGQVRALEAAEKSSKLALDSNLLGYQVGVRTNIDVLLAQQQVFTTQRDLSRARYDALLAGLRLLASSAALSEDELAKINALLIDPPPETAPVSLAPASR